MKKSFILYADQYEIIKHLSDAQIGKLMRYVFQYSQNGHHESQIKDPLINLAFSVFKSTIIRDAEKYDERCKKNKESVEKRWREYKRIQSYATEYERIRPLTNHTDSDNGNDNDNGNESDSDSGSEIKDSL